MQCKQCPLCGAYLDPGERCDCKEKEAAPLPRDRPQTNSSNDSVAFGESDVKPRKECVSHGF